MRKPTSKKRTAKPAPVTEVPPELIETLPENSYSIMMFDNIEGTDVEQVQVSREEYLAIKKMLIKMRGIVIPKAA